MQNFLPQPQIRQVLSPDAIAHPQHLKSGTEVEVTGIFQHGEGGWIAQFFYNGRQGVCDPRNLLPPVMYELQRDWAEVQYVLDLFPAPERTEVIINLLDTFEDVNFSPNMCAILLSSTLAHYRGGATNLRRSAMNEIGIHAYMLMFRVMDTDQVACVGIRKIDGAWTIIDSHHLPAAEYEAWCDFLKSCGYTIESNDLDVVQGYVVAIMPNGTAEEAAQAGWWFWNLVVAS